MRETKKEKKEGTDHCEKHALKLKVIVTVSQTTKTEWLTKAASTAVCRD